MSQFASSNLSPRRTDERPLDLPYGLTWADLRPILATSGDSLSGWSAATAYEKRALDGGDNSCILSLRRSGADTTSRHIVFIKRTGNQSAREAARYRLLASAGVPLPAMLACVSREEAEVIVLEFLPRIGIDFQSPSEVEALLELVARLNAVRVDDEVESKPPVVPNDFDQQVLAALGQLERRSLLRLPADRVFEAYQRAQIAVASEPLALNHGEFYFQQVGWSGRQTGEQLVVFDLATLALRPRFADIQGVLPLLVEETGRPEEELFRIYLKALARFGGQVDHRTESLRELRMMRIANSCWALPWLANSSSNTSGFDLRSELALKVRWLCDDVERLGLVTTA